MSQTVSASFQAQSDSSAKEIDFALVIAGWPTIFTVSKSYTLPSGTVDLSTANGFDAKTKAWANLPDVAGSATKGRPEEGSCSISQVNIDVLDRIANGKRAITDLCARQSYLNDSASFPRTVLVADIDADDTTIVLQSVDGLPVLNGSVFIGQECVTYDVATWAPSPRLVGCARGSRLTLASRHGAGATVYGFMPDLYWRRALLYKGYQGLGLDKWARAFGGVIGGVSREGSNVRFSLFDTLWLAYANGEQVLLGPPATGTAAGVFRPVRLKEESGDPYNDRGSLVFRWEKQLDLVLDDPSEIGGGHFAVRVGGSWAAITSASEI